MIETLICDLGGVLVHVDKEVAVSRFSKINGLSNDANRQIMTENIDYMRDKICPRRFALYYIEKLGLKISEKKFHEIYADVFTINDDVVNILKDIKNKIKFIMLSNTERVTIKHLKNKHPQILSLFNGNLEFSYDIKLVKPDNRIYQYIIKKYDLDPDKTLFIDDNIKNVQSAEKIGIKTIHYSSIEKFKKDLMNNNLII